MLYRVVVKPPPAQLHIFNWTTQHVLTITTGFLSYLHHEKVTAGQCEKVSWLLPALRNKNEWIKKTIYGKRFPVLEPFYCLFVHAVSDLKLSAGLDFVSHWDWGSCYADCLHIKHPESSLSAGEQTCWSPLCFWCFLELCLFFLGAHVAHFSFLRSKDSISIFTWCLSLAFCLNIFTLFLFAFLSFNLLLTY